jgi:hypothetical protein
MSLHVYVNAAFSTKKQSYRLAPTASLRPCRHRLAAARMASVDLDETVPLASADEKDERAAAGGAGGGEDADHEQDDSEKMAPPRYHEGDGIDGGLRCYLCNDVVAKKWFRWHALLEHVRRMHGVTHKMLNGNYIHKMARDQVGEQSKGRYKARAAANAGTTSCGAAARSTDPCRADSPQHNGWKQVSCWVRYHADGTPVSPLECILSDRSAQAVAANAAMDEEKAVEWEKAAEWVGSLPDVEIRQVHVDCDAPPTSKNGCRTRAWPVKLRASAVELTELRQFLTTKKNMNAVGTNDALRGMSRVLDMLEVNGEPIEDARSRAARPTLCVWPTAARLSRAAASRQPQTGIRNTGSGCPAACGSTCALDPGCSCREAMRRFRLASALAVRSQADAMSS